MSTEANELSTTITTCFSCGNNILPEDAYCPQCAYPIHGTVEKREQFMNNRNYKHIELDEMKRKIRSGTTTMYVLASLCALSGAIYFGISKESQNQIPEVLTYGVLAALYIGLAVWSKKQPLPAMTCGLVLYIIVLLLSVIDNPMNLARGIIVKIIIIVYLIKAVRSASDARRIKKELNL